MNLISQIRASKRLIKLLYCGGEGEIDLGHAGRRPAGVLRVSKIAPGDFVELMSPVKSLRFQV